MNIEAWKDAGQFSTFDGADVFFRAEAVGDPLLLIHGFPTASWDWKAQWQPFTDAGYRPIAPDLLGFGYSDKNPAGPYLLSRQADMIETVLSELGVTSCKILAHDYGDTVAQELLARHNEDVLGFEIESLCFLNGGLFPGHHHPRPIQKILASPIGPFLCHFMNRGFLDRGLKSVFGPDTPPTTAEVDAFWELMKTNKGHLILSQLLSYMKQRKTHEARWVGALQNTDIPLRLINGVQDPVSGGHLADHYEHVIPDADIIRLNVGHYPQIEAADDVTMHALAFFKRD